MKSHLLPNAGSVGQGYKSRSAQRHRHRAAGFVHILKEGTYELK